MINKSLSRFLMSLLMMGVLLLTVSTVGAQSINLPISSNIDRTTGVVAPYWQANTPASGQAYTFIAITHPSLSGMNSLIGLTATAFLGDGATLTAYGTSVDFTIAASATHRLFIFGTPQTSGVFPALGTLISTDSTVSGILGTSNGGDGFIRFDPIATAPKAFGANGFQDITALSYWGAIVFEGVNTGFAMEFIGDLSDSGAHPGMAADQFPSGVK